MWIGETEKHFVQLLISVVLRRSRYLILFKEIGEEFLRVSTEDTDILVALGVSILGTLGTESRDFLVHEFSDLYPYLHTQDQLFWEQWR